MVNKSSINQNELNKFSKTYEEWWDETGEFYTLHAINPIRIKYITTKIKEHFKIKGKHAKPLSNLELIDIGCGGGLACVPLYTMGAEVTGLDASMENIHAATEHAKKHKLKISYLNKTLETHIKSKKKYDVVLCLEVIEHVENQKDFIQNLTKLLKPSGMIIISTINRTIKSYILAIIMAEYILGWIPKRTHDHSRFIRPSELKRMLNDEKVQIKELKGLTIEVSSKNWQLSEDIDVNYFAFIA